MDLLSFCFVLLLPYSLVLYCDLSMIAEVRLPRAANADREIEGRVSYQNKNSLTIYSGEVFRSFVHS